MPSSFSNGFLYLHILFAKIKQQRKELIWGSFIQPDLFALRIQSIQTQLSRAAYFSASSFSRSCLGGETHKACGGRGAHFWVLAYPGCLPGRDPALSFRALCVAPTWPPGVSPHSLRPPYLPPASIWSFVPSGFCISLGPGISQVCSLHHAGACRSATDSGPLTWTPPSAPVPAALGPR